MKVKYIKSLFTIKEIINENANKNGWKEKNPVDLVLDKPSNSTSLFNLEYIQSRDLKKIIENNFLPFGNLCITNILFILVIFCGPNLLANSSCSILGFLILWFHPFFKKKIFY